VAIDSNNVPEDVADALRQLVRDARQAAAQPGNEDIVRAIGANWGLNAPR
jgi:hypothetical protein